MLFSLQKLIWFIMVPPGCIFLLLLFGAAMSYTGRKRLGQVLIVVGILLFYLLSLPAVADLLLRPLESAHPPLSASPRNVAAVVVPGGGSVDLTWAGAHPVPNEETWTRLIAGADLAKRLQVPLVLTGGNGEPFSRRLNDADVMAEAAARLGMTHAQLVVENVSRNTLENSHAVRRLVSGNRIVLATSAYYMKRAVAMFRRRGFEVVPAPVFHQVQTRKKGLVELIPRAGTFAASSCAVAEWLSICWWSIRGEM